MSTYFLYAVKTGDLEVGRRWVEAAVGANPGAHTNEYSGNYYTFQASTNESLKLVFNKRSDEDGDYLAEDRFPEHALLLYVDVISGPTDLAKAFESAPEHFEKLRVREV